MLKNPILAFHSREHYDLFRKNSILRRMETKNAQWRASNFTVWIFLPSFFPWNKLSLDIPKPLAAFLCSGQLFLLQLL